ncbi:TrbC/VirB2 family protein [Caballeronia sp. SEWSISQ10-4 2]|uniref:TrbC/VirB2 family protein n=1 Tax=Caballeronia sp. SEWSISQ10-4 2 TaxID=2937438 RepID=UPI00264FBC8A|nr:TrbC/VirB2 family protein [Caballeronia sp. SEWSISQ10-4 2]MDN7179365.1 TrbC/VirB2 family protein [Caballeronia sp. SEWSISQ10-4 2]
MKSVILYILKKKNALQRRFFVDAKAARLVASCVPVLVMASPAYAELSQVNTLLTTIQTTLLGVGGVVCSISIIWAGFKMMFQHARFGDIANVFIGGLFVGCATVIAAMLISTT